MNYYADIRKNELSYTSADKKYVQDSLSSKKNKSGCKREYVK